MSEASIRLATAADRDAVAGLRRTWGEEDGADGADDGFTEAFESWWDRELDQRLTWLAEVDGDPVGMLNLLVFVRMPKPGRVHSRWGYVANVYVRADHRDRGLGGRLLA